MSLTYQYGDPFVSGTNYNAASASRTDVNTAIALTVAGDTVTVPAGSVSWAGDISISGITLIGPGKDAGSPLTVTAGAVNITKHATEETRLTGVRFTGDNLHVTVGGDAANEIFQIYDNYFYSGGSVWADQTTNGGIWWGNEMEAAVGHNADTFKINLGTGAVALASWTAATTMGTDDTTGKVNTYFEDNTWDWFGEVTVDVDNGARVVIRHDTYNNSSMVYHGGGSGTSGQDTSTYGGRQCEIYDCDFVRDSLPSASSNKWAWIRGGGGFVFANNAVDNNSTGDYPNKNNLRFSVGCPGDPGYPLQYQVGQSTISADSTPDQPALVFGNTGSAIAAGLITLTGLNGAGITCSVPGDYVQSGRDYETTNTWGWTAYTYPHPLRADQ